MSDSKLGSVSRTRILVENDVTGPAHALWGLYTQAVAELPDATDVTIIVSKAISPAEISDIENMIEDSGEAGDGN